MNTKWTAFACLGMTAIAGMVTAQTATTPPPPAAVVIPGTKGVNIKIDGRMFVGIFDTGAQGAYPNRTLAIPDAKLRFTFNVGENLTVVNRFSNKNATNDGFDYFYVDLNNWGGALPGHTLRAGKVKIDTGEETWTDNPVENILISNSAAAVGGYDEGVNFRGPIRAKRPVSYSLSVLNASKGADVSSNGLATAAKIGGSPLDNLYLSGSYYQTGDLVKADGSLASTDLKVANLQNAPAGASTWQRRVVEVDARWNYGPNGTKAVIGAPAGAPFQLAAAYGAFTDDATGAAKRSGQYWYVEGLYNASKKIYLATRVSKVSLDDGYTDKLVDSPVAVNSYRRLSMGVGYRLTDLTHIKAEYSLNDTNGGASEPKLNQVALGLATKF